MMKIYCSAIFLLSIVISASATSLENKLVAATSLSWDNDYFLGDWKAWGYGCDNQTPPNELFNVYHENGQFFAKKTLGDNCVTTGTVSFKGSLQPYWKINTNYPATYTLGNKQRPNSSFGNTNIQIQDINRFSAPAWGLRYERITPVAPVVPVAPVTPTRRCRKL